MSQPSIGKKPPVRELMKRTGATKQPEWSSITERFQTTMLQLLYEAIMIIHIGFGLDLMLVL